MTLNPFASTLLVAWYVIGSVAGTIMLAVLAIALRKLDSRLEALESRVIPVVERTESILTKLEDQVHVAGDTAVRILSKTEATMSAVESTAQKSNRLATKALHYPLIEVNAVTYGIFAGAVALFKRPSTSVKGETN
ncbi:MAG: hypothetical protein ACOVT5_06975 [Armatimonadaceae bacterium]